MSDNTLKEFTSRELIGSAVVGGVFAALLTFFIVDQNVESIEKDVTAQFEYKVQRLQRELQLKESLAIELYEARRDLQLCKAKPVKSAEQDVRIVKLEVAVDMLKAERGWK